MPSFSIRKRRVEVLKSRKDAAPSARSPSSPSRCSAFLM